MLSVWNQAFVFGKDSIHIINHQNIKYIVKKLRIDSLLGTKFGACAVADQIVENATQEEKGLVAVRCLFGRKISVKVRINFKAEMIGTVTSISNIIESDKQLKCQLKYVLREIVKHFSSKTHHHHRRRHYHHGRHTTTLTNYVGLNLNRKVVSSSIIWPLCFLTNYA